MNAAAGAGVAQMAWGVVRHARLRPARHAFAYPTAFLLLPMRALARHACPALARNRRAWLSFHDADHGDGGPDALAWVDALLREHGVSAAGEVWLQTYPRVLGHTFKPVSFWYAHDAGGALRAVVAEVNNTFGDRHVYLLRPPAGRATLDWGQTIVAPKRFHVSPFFAIEGHYAFRFLRTADRLVARVELHDADGVAVLRTSLSGRLQPLTRACVRATLWRMPLLTIGVVARIHRQALALWARRVPWFSRPAPPAHPVTLGAPPPPLRSPADVA